MKKTLYYQAVGTNVLYTTFQAKKIPGVKNGKKIILTKENFDPFYGGLNELSTKDLRKAKVRKDLQKLGIVW